MHLILLLNSKEISSYASNFWHILHLRASKSPLERSRNRKNHPLLLNSPPSEILPISIYILHRSLPHNNHLLTRPCVIKQHSHISGRSMGWGRKSWRSKRNLEGLEAARGFAAFRNAITHVVQYLQHDGSDSVVILFCYIKSRATILTVTSTIKNVRQY